MPRKAKGARLWLRPPREDRGSVWVILHRGVETSTGCAAGDIEGAEKAFSTYLAEKYEAPKTGGKLDRTFIADVLTLYVKQVAPKAVRPDVIGYTAGSAGKWWDDKTLADVHAENCDLYVKWRVKQGVSDQTARHDLKTLRAAIRHYHASKHGPLTAVPIVTLPQKRPAMLDYWLTRKQIADRIRAARKRPRCKHLIRMYLIGVYSGTRPGAVKKLRWVPSTEGGWFDLETETLHRRGRGTAESNKRQPHARIHDRLLPWLRRWRAADMAEGITHVIHYYGKPITKFRSAWAAVAKDAGHIEGDGPHILRHTCATWMMQSGVDPYEAAGFLGMSVKTLLEVYGHHHKDFQQRAARADGRRTK